MSIWEITWSSFIGATIIAAGMGLQIYLSGSSQQMTSNLITQRNMADFHKIIQNDFGKIGYRDTTGCPVLVSTSDTLKFLSDIDDNSTIDTVLYYRGSTTERLKTENPDDFLLYRVILHTDTIRFNIGLTNFSFTYYDSIRGVTSNPALVRGFTINARLESANKNQDSTRSGVAWSTTFYPRNLNTPK